MKTSAILGLAALSGALLAASASAADMSKMKGMATSSGAKTGHATGVVTAVDA
jgi:hypothetical protein